MGVDMAYEDESLEDRIRADKISAAMGR